MTTMAAAQAAIQTAKDGAGPGAPKEIVRGSAKDRVGESVRTKQWKDG